MGPSDGLSGTTAPPLASGALASDGTSPEARLRPDILAHLLPLFASDESRICTVWAHHLRASGSPYYNAVDAEELQASLCSMIRAFASYLETGDDDPLVQDVHRIARVRLAQGFPLSDLERAVGAMRIGVFPLLVEAFPNDHASLTEAVAALMAAEELASVQIAVAYQEAMAEKLQAAHEKSLRAEDEKLRFCRDMARVVTHGRLNLCDHEDIPENGGAPLVQIREPRDVRKARHDASAIAEGLGWDTERCYALQLCIGEAGTNALKHGGAAAFQVWAGDDGSVTFRIADAGPGIDFDRIPSALSSGYSTGQTLGMGFTVMLEMADMLHLATDTRGTTIQLTLQRHVVPVNGRRAF